MPTLVYSASHFLLMLLLLFQEEEDIFCVLFFIGKNHGNFTAKRVKDHEVELQAYLLFA